MPLPHERLSELLDRLREWLSSRRRTRRLEHLHHAASEASSSFRPQYKLQGAQVARALDRHSEALSLYGEAIDGYLEDGRIRAAEVVCRKVLQEYPDVVRARRTLTLMTLGRQEIPEATRLLHDYVTNARKTGDSEVLIKSLRVFVLLAESEEFQAEALKELEGAGDVDGARRIREELEAPAPPIFEGLGPWTRMIQAALLDPERLRSLPI